MDGSSQNLGLCNLCRRSVQSFDRTAAFLNGNYKEELRKVFGLLDENDSSTAIPLKEPLLSSPAQALQRSTSLDKLDADVRDKHIGCVVLPEQEDRRKSSAAL